MIDESLTFTVEDSTLPLHTAPLTQEELDEIIENGDQSESGRFEGVFRVPLRPLMELDGDDAGEFITDSCVLDHESYCLAYEIEDWSFVVVGCEPGNILHVYVEGLLVII